MFLIIGNGMVGLAIAAGLSRSVPAERITVVGPISRPYSASMAAAAMLALVAAARLSARYIADRNLPDKAVDLMDEAAAKLRLDVESRRRHAQLVRRT